MHNVFYRNGLHYNIAGYFLHFDAIISAVEEDIGIGILNQVNYENIQKEIKKIKVKGLSLECPYYLVCPKSNSSEPLVKSFIGFCQENFEYVKNRYGDSYDNS